MFSYSVIPDYPKTMLSDFIFYYLALSYTIIIIIITTMLLCFDNDW